MVEISSVVVVEISSVVVVEITSEIKSVSVLTAASESPLNKSTTESGIMSLFSAMTSSKVSFMSPKISSVDSCTLDQKLSKMSSACPIASESISIYVPI